MDDDIVGGGGGGVTFLLSLYINICILLKKIKTTLLLKIILF